MALLFGRNNRAANQPKNAVEFRAGKMSVKGNMVSPDKRKGMVYIYQSEDGLTHFCWKDRSSNVVEDDLIIFPEDAAFSKVTQCKEESRVFLLKFKASSRKLFYWMQEPKADGDSDLVWKVNDAINNPGGSSAGRGGSASNSTTPSEQEMQNLLQSMSQSQLMQLIGGMNDLEGASSLLSQMGLGNLGALTGGAEGRTGSSAAGSGALPALTADSVSSTPVPNSSKKEDISSTSKSSASKPVQLQDLQKILSGIQPPAVSVDLSAGVSSDFVKRITSSPTTVQKLTPLLPNFGFTSSNEGKDPEPKEVVGTLLSPAFQLGPLVEQFQFGKDAVQAAKSGNLEAFLNAIQKEVDSKAQETSEPSEKPEDMNVD